MDYKNTDYQIFLSYISEKLTINSLDKPTAPIDNCLALLMLLIQKAIKLRIPLKFKKKYDIAFPDSIL